MSWTQLLLCLLLVLGGETAREPRSFKHLAPRVGTKFFLRMNTKVDVVPYTPIFAYASGFRLNWDIRAQDSSPLFFIGQRRQLHDTIAATLQGYGLQGRDCMMRALCELAHIQSHTDIISNILKVLFKAEEEASCPAEFDCPISLIALPYLLYSGSNQLQ